jgi:hypothetical protein
MLQCLYESIVMYHSSILVPFVNYKENLSVVDADSTLHFIRNLQMAPISFVFVHGKPFQHNVM